MSQAPDPVPPATNAGPIDYGTAAPGAYAGPPPTKDEQNMALLCYVLAIFTGFVGPLIIWLMKKDSSAFVADQGKEVLNWAITVTIAAFVAGLTMFLFIGFLLLPAVFLCNLIFTIMGAIKVSKGVPYRYPFALRLIK